MSFKDYFSAHAETYASARPTYPEQLFEFLAAQCNHHDLAWDCATGNGQAARALARHFDQVIASDGSAEQIEQAEPASNIDYRQHAAEDSFLEPDSIDLVSVAQALHWFDLDAFFANVQQCLKPDGALAVWSYGIHTIDDGIDAIVGEFYQGTLDAYWPPERKIVENHYRDIEFPFETVREEGIVMERSWNFHQLCAYLYSWSALQRYMRKNDEDPLIGIQRELLRAWGGDAEIVRTVRWPLTVIIGRL